MPSFPCFTLTADPWPPDLSNAIECHPWLGLALNPDGSSAAPVLWSQRSDDMRAFSLDWPGVTFVLECDDGDRRWREVVREGMSRFAAGRVVFDEVQVGDLT